MIRSCLCLGSFVAAGIGEIGYGSGHVDGGECADNHTEYHCEYKRADGIAAEDEDAQEHEKCRARGHHCTAEGRVDR